MKGIVVDQTDPFRNATTYTCTCNKIKPMTDLVGATIYVVREVTENGTGLETS